MMLRVQKTNHERRRRQQAAQDKAGAIFTLTMLLNVPILLFQLVYRKMQPVVIVFIGTGTYITRTMHASRLTPSSIYCSRACLAVSFIRRRLVNRRTVLYIDQIAVTNRELNVS
jgi:hypothetical protein